MGRRFAFALLLLAAPAWGAGSPDSGGGGEEGIAEKAPENTDVPQRVTPPDRVLLLDTEILMRMRDRLQGDPADEAPDAAESGSPEEDHH